MGLAPHLVCRRSERRCACDHALAASLELLERLPCGSCYDDDGACDCLVQAWLLRHALLRRPCWCQGLCDRTEALYLCRQSEACDGHLTRQCTVTLHWCPRVHAYPCSRCHATPTDDLDDHC